MPRIQLLEFDERFEVFEEFIHYDFEKSLQLPIELKDPPYHSEDCQRKCE
jgi:hypothetical protein